jgi:hypothetical protein
MRTSVLPFLLLLAACGGDDETDTTDTDTDTPATFDDAAIAADLWVEIAGYDTWGRPAGWSDAPVLSGNHMGAYVIRYDNGTLSGWSGSGTAPEGSVSVKEEYADEAGTTLNDLTVMKKVPGYDPDHGDWFWAMYMPDGSVGMSGKVDMCYGCHAASPTDYLHTDPPTGM